MVLLSDFSADFFAVVFSATTFLAVAVFFVVVFSVILLFFALLSTFSLSGLVDLVEVFLVAGLFLDADAFLILLIMQK